MWHCNVSFTNMAVDFEAKTGSWLFLLTCKLVANLNANSFLGHSNWFSQRSFLCEWTLNLWPKIGGMANYGTFWGFFSPIFDLFLPCSLARLIVSVATGSLFQVAHVFCRAKFNLLAQNSYIYFLLKLRLYFKTEEHNTSIMNSNFDMRTM